MIRDNPYAKMSNKRLKAIILSYYRGLLKQYYRNLGGYSDDYETLITPSLISVVERRYIQLGGRIEPLYAKLRKKN
jgi:hypothetical protein|tara:strand:+ start:122 stop:349 length:228 start_codon:yes stop_codon:yes gene_type:complete